MPSSQRARALLWIALSSFVSSAAEGAATIVIQSGDSAGVGFNDATPATPVGGNTGTTLGQQRMIALQAAANKWGATLNSVPTITILVSWNALSCSANSALLGSTSPQREWHDFAGAPHNTWYPSALANALFGADLDPTTTEIRTRFNVNLGKANCLAGVPFYLGLDNNHGNSVDLVTVATHEFAHGLGFETPTDESTGAEFSDGTATLPSIFDNFLHDDTTGLLWKDMTNAQRAASAINTGHLAWNGPNVVAAVPQVLSPGAPLLTVTSPATAAGTYFVGLADFGPSLTSPGVTGQLAQAVDTGTSTSLACNPLPAANAAAVSGKIALLDRGTCNFTVKVENAQNAGALAVLIADNVAGSPPDALGGSDSTIFIPAVRISLADGAALKSAMANGPVTANLGINLAILQGADASNRALIYAPNPVQSGSSISHFDVSASPSLLMEPAINGDLTHEVTPPHDLTAPLLMDIGWTLSVGTGPGAPALASPANGATGIGLTPPLSWSASTGANSYDVYFGASPVPPLVMTTPNTTFTPGALSSGTTYFWRVVANSSNGSASSDTWSFTTSATMQCSFVLSTISGSFNGSGGSSSVAVTSPSSCAWTAASNADWVTITGGANSTGNGTVSFTVAANPTSTLRSGTLSIAGLSFVVNESTLGGARFIPITPCRVVDTRNATGAFGGPMLAALGSRDFTIPNGACNIPATATAYSLNVSVVPRSTLGFVTVWPSGQPQPNVATLTSLDGRIRSNAAIVPAGASGAISVYTTDATDLVLDINGYFVPVTNTAALAFYPVTPCRIADTRNPVSPLAGPSLLAQSARTFPIAQNACGVPATAQAYSLNFAAIPKGSLGFLTAWPTGQAQPETASLTATTGTITANAVIVPAGSNGSVDVYSTDATDLVIDVDGYFAPAGTGGLSLYNLAPCRVLDSRKPSGAQPFTGSRDVNVTASGCGAPAAAQAYVFNATVVPPGPFGFLTLWPQGQAQPNAGTLNALDGAITSNMAIVPANNGSISAFALNPTQLVLDVFGYFAP